MSKYISRQELDEWIDQEGGLDYFINGHGFDPTELDPEDTELVEAYAAAEKAAFAFEIVKQKLYDLIES